jgi:hypothetical protein
MIELICDGKERDVLIYTDDSRSAVKLRKVFSMQGAVYSGKEKGYSWRLPKRAAILVMKKLGLHFERKESVDN